MKLKPLIVLLTTLFIYTSCSETSNDIKTDTDEDKVQIPHFYIDTENNAPIASKENYINGTLNIDGGNKYNNFEGAMAVRGRGNSTWKMPKKPFRLKLNKKASILGLAAERDWILLANYIDPSLMCNAAAMKIGQLLEMPFTHHMIPVDVTLNGRFLGNYMLTEQKEVTKNRIDIGKNGWLLELDHYFDEDWQFKSDRFGLPVMIQHPKLNKRTDAEAQALYKEIKNDFQTFENLLFEKSFPNNNYLDYFDADAFVNYMIVYALTANEEINLPNSVYMYKKENGKYTMGPIWDFDWAFGYEENYKHFENPYRNLFWPHRATGKFFFLRIMQDPAIKDLFKTKWVDFKAHKYPLLIKYLNEYAETIRESQQKDQERWGKYSGSMNKYKTKMIEWLDQRTLYMDSFME